MKEISTLRPHGWLRKAVGEAVRARRRDIGLTQGQLGEAIGTRYQTVGSIEEGDRPTDMDTIESIARELDVPPAALLAPGAWRRVLESFPSLDEDEANYLLGQLGNYRSAKAGEKASDSGRGSGKPG